jgi:hypothetical protein
MLVLLQEGMCRFIEKWQTEVSQIDQLYFELAVGKPKLFEPLTNGQSSPAWAGAPDYYVQCE